jgi:hypothetical protein
MLETQVYYITLHTALNLLWLGISVAAFAWFWSSERSRSRSGRWQRQLAVFALCVTLFPSVSDTDDLFNFSLMQVPGRHYGGVGTAPPPPQESREKSTLQLARLLETLDHYQITGFYALILALFCVFVLLSLRAVWTTRSVFCNAGRAPPPLA